MFRRFVSLAAAAILLGACGSDDKSVTETCGSLTRECLWNPDTQASDRACVYVSPDGAPFTCDGGASAGH
jgi:hypothetical protein